MANDNKTVAEIVKQVRRECNSLPLPNAAGEKLKLVREINDAHQREIAAKDAEIARLRALVKELAFNLDAWVHGGRFAVTESDLEVLEKYEKEAK